MVVVASVVTCILNFPLLFDQLLKELMEVKLASETCVLKRLRKRENDSSTKSSSSSLTTVLLEKLVVCPYVT